MAARPAHSPLRTRSLPCMQYDVTVLRKVASSMGWTSAQMNWTCWHDREALEAALLPGGACDIAIAGLRISIDALKRGVAFSWPLFLDGLAIVAPVEPSNQGDGWIFFEAFRCAPAGGCCCCRRRLPPACTPGGCWNGRRSCAQRLTD